MGYYACTAQVDVVSVYEVVLLFYDDLYGLCFWVIQLFIWWYSNLAHSMIYNEMSLFSTFSRFLYMPIILSVVFYYPMLSLHFPKCKGLVLKRSLLELKLVFDYYSFFLVNPWNLRTNVISLVHFLYLVFGLCCKGCVPISFKYCNSCLYWDNSRLLLAFIKNLYCMEKVWNFLHHSVYFILSCSKWLVLRILGSNTSCYI